MPIGGAMTADIDPEKELAKFNAAAELLARLVPASIKATRPQDWVQMGDKVYLQGTGAERVAPLWGIVLGEPHVEKVEHEDGHYDYVVTGAAGSRRTGVYMRSVQGGRSSRDKFFWPAVAEDANGRLRLRVGDELGAEFNPAVHIDHLDVRKAAVTNWQTRAVAMLAGLRGLSPSDLSGAGIEGVARVEFERGGKGGATVKADVKAEQNKLGNAVLEYCGGDKERARRCLKELTKGDKPGKDGKVFQGFTSVAKLTRDWQFERAWQALEKLKKAKQTDDSVEF